MNRPIRRGTAGALTLLLATWTWGGMAMAGTALDAGTAATGAPLVLRVYSDYV